MKLEILLSRETRYTNIILPVRHFQLASFEVEDMTVIFFSDFFETVIGFCFVSGKETGSSSMSKLKKLRRRISASFGRLCE